MKEMARQARAGGRILGFVPTMGALHEGHTSLLARAKKECSPLIASIFVNPKQFGPNEDFAKYPRAFESDSEKLKQAGVDVLFAPEAAELYPKDFSTYVQVEGFSERLEGRSRPGHFHGVATVVMKLLQIVQPHRAYFGRKDAQQARLITQMARNVYLNPDERQAATVLYRALEAAKDELARGVRDALQLKDVVQRTLSKETLANVDYAEIVDAQSFEPVVRMNKACYVLLAVFFGKTRLIDNLYVEPASPNSDGLLFHL